MCAYCIVLFVLQCYCGKKLVKAGATITDCTFFDRVVVHIIKEQLN